MFDEHKLITERYEQCKEERSKYIERWKDIERFVSITSDVNSEFEQNKQPSYNDDEFINDPTGITCVNNAGDYLAGILWEPNLISLEASEQLKESAHGGNFEEFFNYATEKFRKQMNHSDAGFTSVLRSYAYDQYGYGTSGIGTFRSKEFDAKQSDCCLTFKNYGVQQSCIDEGTNNKIDVVFTVYNWRLNRIIEEFCMEKGVFSQKLFEQLPEQIRKSYNDNKFNDKFKLVNGILPNKSYQLNSRGINGAKFKGYWFIEHEKKIFKEEYYSTLPIAFCRQIRCINKIYGESAGTIAISSVKMLNYISGVTVDNIEKTTDTPLGVVSGALVNGNVLDRSAGAINNINAKALANGQNPFIPVSQVGDISAVINFLLPQLKQDINNIFKLDQLLDFNNQTQMSATESSYRMSIRGKSISGIISQQKTELLEPVIHRAISVMQECNIFGYALDDIEDALQRENAEQNLEFIPDDIANFMKDGKQWYTIKYNGEIERLANNELYEAVGRFIQFLSFALQVDPNVVHAIDTYEMITFLKKVSNLVNEKFIVSKTKYNELMQELQNAQEQQMQLQNALQNAQLDQMNTASNKNQAEADNMNEQNLLSEYGY